MLTDALTQTVVRLRALPDRLLVGVGACIMAALVALHLSGGGGALLADLFLIPVLGVGWLARSPWWAFALAFMAAPISVCVDAHVQAGLPLLEALPAIAVRLLVYLVLVGVLDAMRRAQAERDAEARVDHLTGIANARAFHEAAEAEIERSHRGGHLISLLYLDLDDFKAINDDLGHAEGNRVLHQVGSLLHRAVRRSDTPARVGGDEFVVLMPETGSGAALEVSRRLGQAIARIGVADGRLVSCSIGVVTFSRPPADVGALLHAGDERMYEVKKRGKGDSPPTEQEAQPPSTPREKADVRSCSSREADPPPGSRCRPGAPLRRLPLLPGLLRNAIRPDIVSGGRSLRRN